MNELERDIEKSLRQMVEKHGGLCLKWVCPGWSGVPDRIILMPGGRVLFAETKRPKGGKLRRLQSWWQERLIKFGFHACVIWTAEDIQALERIILDKEVET